MVIEVMGHNAGWIALYAGIAGGGDIILIPEIGYDIKNVCKEIEDRFSKGKNSAIVVVAEGIRNPVKDSCSTAQSLSKKIGELTGLETRETVLGYIQRGGSPSRGGQRKAGRPDYRRSHERDDRSRSADRAAARQCRGCAGRTATGAGAAPS